MSEERHYCSFCGKRDDEVTMLIAGPGRVFICDGCVGLCADMVRDKAPKHGHREAVPADFGLAVRLEIRP